MNNNLNKIIQECVTIAGSRLKLAELSGVSCTCVGRWVRGDFYPEPMRALLIEKQINKILKDKGSKRKISRQELAPHFDWKAIAQK